MTLGWESDEGPEVAFMGQGGRSQRNCSHEPKLESKVRQTQPRRPSPGPHV